MASEKRLIPLRKRIIYAGDVFAALMKRGWSCTDASDFVKSIHTVDAVEVVHGRWEFRPSEKYKFCIDVVCTACNTAIDSHHENLLEYRQTAIKRKLLYCPNCGAKMDGGNKE